VAISSGVYGLTGVVIGGGITTGTQWAMAWRTDRLDARVAKRQVRTELEELRAAVYDKNDQPASVDWFERVYKRAGTAKWEEHSDRLGRTMSKPDWTAVNGAFRLIRGLNDVCREAREGEDQQQRQAALETFETSPPQTVEFIDDAVRRLE
jgi:hypothetical protein